MKKRLTYEGLVAGIAVLESSLSAKEATMADLDSKIARKEERMAYLERLLFGSKRDKLASKAAASDQPGLFDELFNGAYDGRAAQIRQKAGENRGGSG